MDKTTILGDRKFKQVPQPVDSFNDNPCWDCVFGMNDGECHAPQEVLDFDEKLDDHCGFHWTGTNYVYAEEV